MVRLHWIAVINLCASVTTGAQAPLCVDQSFQFGHPPAFEVSSIAFMNDGRIIACGHIKAPSAQIQYTGITRVMPNGAIDPGFGPSYILSGDAVTIRDSYIFLQSGGKAIRRLFLEDGTYDYSYVTGAFQAEYYATQVLDFHIFPDGKQWRTGYYSRDLYDDNGHLTFYQPGYGLVQALPSGALDPDFAPKYMPDTYLRNLSELPDGRFLMGARNGFEYEGRPVGALFKLWPNGDLDTTFRTSITWSGGVGSHNYYYPDGRMLVFGRLMAPEYPNDTLAVMRLMPDGSTDTTWPSIPFLAHGYYRGLAAVWDHLEIEPGKLIVVGDFNAIGDEPLGAITTIDTAGNVLWDYLPGTGAGFTEMIDTSQPRCFLKKIRIGPDGYIYICGAFQGYNDGCGDHTEQRMLMRLYPLDVGVRRKNTVKSPLVMPNPGNGAVQINWPGCREFRLEVMDALGRVVATDNVVEGNASVNLSHVKAGVYNLLMTAPNGMRASAKWLKQ